MKGTVTPYKILLQPPIKGTVYTRHYYQVLITEVCFLWTCTCPVMTSCWGSRSTCLLVFAVTPCLSTRWRLLDFHISWLAEGVLCLINGVIMLCRLESCIKCAFTALRRVSFGESRVEFQAPPELKIYYGCCTYGC